MNTGLAHHHKRSRALKGKPLINTKLSRFIDKVIYPVGSISLIMTIPQLYDIWLLGKVDGVSILTWGTWCVVSVFWLLYGMVHKAPLLIVMHSGWIVVQVLVVLGVLYHS